MKKILCFLASLVLVTFNSCHNDEENDISENKLITIIVLYSSNYNINEEIPDVGANVYIYFNLLTGDLVDYIYEGKGKLTKGEKIILPDEKMVTDHNGIASILSDQTYKDATVIIESNYYKDKWLWSSFSNNREGVVLKGVFNP